MRVLAFLLSVLAVATMAATSGYVASRWDAAPAGTHAAFGATAGIWALALGGLGWAGRGGEPLAWAASVALFGLTLTGQLLVVVMVSAGP